MRKEGRVHGQVHDILAYYGIITSEERDLIKNLLDDNELVQKEQVCNVIKKNFNLFQSLRGKLRKAIKEL